MRFKKRILLGMLLLVLSSLLMRSTLDRSFIQNKPRSSAPPTITQHSNMFFTEEHNINVIWDINQDSYSYPSAYFTIKIDSDPDPIYSFQYDGESSLSYNFVELSEGTHLITATFYDGISDYAYDYFEITTNYNPVVINPSFIMVKNQQTITAEWEVSDQVATDPFYEILYNNEKVVSENLTGPSFTGSVSYDIERVDITGSDIAVLNFWDGYDGFTQKEILLIENNNATIEFNTNDSVWVVDDGSLQFTIADSIKNETSAKYNISIDGSLKVSSKLLGATSFSFGFPSELDSGIYTMNFVYDDGYGEIKEILIYCVKNYQDFMTEEEDTILITEYSATLSFSTKQGFTNTGFYHLYIDDSYVEEKSFYNTIDYVVDPIGDSNTHKYAFFFKNTNEQVDYQVITFTPNIAPTIRNPHDSFYNVNSSNPLNLEWEIIDSTIILENAQFNVKIDELSLFTISPDVDSNPILEYSIKYSEFSKGNHTLIFTFSDGAGLSVSEEIIFSVSKIEKEGLSSGAIAGIVVGSLFVVVAGLVFYLTKKGIIKFSGKNEGEKETEKKEEPRKITLKNLSESKTYIPEKSDLPDIPE